MVLSESPQLFILEVANFSINIIFLVLFIYRFVILRSFAKTERYKDYLPKLRIFFSMLYVVVNLALMVNTVINNMMKYTAVDMALVVVGEGIDSIILIIQLFVLRLELLKEQPYTRFHISYFLYLCLFSTVRFIIFFVNKQGGNDIVNIVLSGILILDSIVQITYWIAKKQSLPQFQIHTNVQIDSLKHHSKLIQNVFDFTQRSFRKVSEDNFPYIVPFVSVDNGRIKVILEIANYSQYFDNLDIDSLALPKPDNPNLNRATRSQDTYNSQAHSREILSSGYYSIEEIKNLYVICSRFPMQKSLNFNFAPISLPQMARQLQDFLQQLFGDRRWYQPSVLKYLKIPIDRMKQYSDIVEKYSIFNKDTDLDQTLGFKVLEDKNSIFFSISIYKHLWIDDHYEFYMKVISKQTQLPYYPIKRFSEFQDFHIALRQKIKNLDRDLQLPLLPKKHLFHWDEDQAVNQRRAQLERYMRLLYNDYTIMQLPALKELLFEFLGIQDEIAPEGEFVKEFYDELSIMKGEINKCIIKSDLVTYYQFKIFRKGIEAAPLLKRFSQFEELHLELQRWMNNIQITYKTVTLPERLYYKSEGIRHEKLRNYLQAVAQIRDIGKVYVVNNFFNIQGNEVDQISQIAYNSRLIERSNNQSNNVIKQVIELTENIEKRQERLSQSSESSRRFSQIINNLGDEAFD